MPLPTSKQELADWILRRLGAPMTNVEIADVQLEDVIDEAVQFFQEFHYDGAERTYRVICIEGDVLDGNNRMHQCVNAPMYDTSKDDTYRLGDRVMTYKPDSTPDKIWIRIDSDETVWHKIFYEDANGNWFVFDSDLANRDSDFTADDTARDNPDSDGVYVVYDSETHNYFIYYQYTPDRYYYQLQPQGTVPNTTSYVDSEGVFVQYDSDKHVVFQYDSDTTGLFVDSEGTFVSYDSDNPNHWTYSYVAAIDSDTSTDKWVDSEGEFVLFDSDVHPEYLFIQDSDGLYVREEGTNRFVLDTVDPVYQIRPEVIHFKRVLVKPQLFDRVYGNVQRYSRQYAYPTVYQLMLEQRWVDSEGTYVMFDSDKHFNWEAHPTGSWVTDSEGNYIEFDSDKHTYIERKDSDGLLVQIDSEFYVYDSDKHNSFVFDSDNSGNYVRVNGIYFVYDSDAHTTMVYDSDPNGAWVIDSEGNYALYDSDKNVYKIHTPDSQGPWVWDSDSADSEFIPYDSDLHSVGWTRYVREDVAWQRYSRHTEKPTFYRRWTSLADRWIVHNAFEVYTQDSDGEWLYDSDTQTYSLYDSDANTVIRYDSDDVGAYIDSDGTFVQYNSSLYFRYVFDSDSINVDSDGIQTPKVPDSEGDLEGKFVRIYSNPEGAQYELFDSAKHSSLFYDSDGAGTRLNFGINLDLVYRRTTEAYTPGARFAKVKVVPEEVLSRRHKRSFTPYIRYQKENDSIEMFYRRSELLGKRFDFTMIRNVRPVGTEWRDYWKEEDSVLTEPVVDYDYSKVGQVGIPVPDTIIGVNKIFRIDNFSGMGMWNYEYQYFLNNFDFFYGNGGTSSMPMTNYYITKSYLDLIDHMMNVQPAIRFNKHRNRLYIDTNWKRLNNMATSKNYYLMMECYEVNDPEVFGDVYKDKWLKRYATALAKMQWGTNMK